MAVLLETSLGDLTIDLYTDERPICKLFELTLLSLIQLKIEAKFIGSQVKSPRLQIAHPVRSDYSVSAI